MSTSKPTLPPITPDQRRKLIECAIESKGRAYAPYSKFRVGAALLSDDGKVIGGCNVENASYGGAICAERTAVVKAVSEGTTKIIGLAVTSDVASPLSPCGICRQVLREFCPLDMPILLVPVGYDPSKASGDVSSQSNTKAALDSAPLAAEGIEVKEVTLGMLLPMSFGPEDLERPRHPN